SRRRQPARDPCRLEESREDASARVGEIGDGLGEQARLALIAGRRRGGVQLRGERRQRRLALPAGAPLGGGEGRPRIGNRRGRESLRSLELIEEGARQREAR